MRAWLVISLFCLQSLALLKPFAPLLFFQFQQAYIADKLCEERFQEISFCGGKCVLQKALEKEFEEQQQPQERSECHLYWLEYPSLLQEVLPSILFPISPCLQEPPRAKSHPFIPADYISRLEKPPRMV